MAVRLLGVPYDASSSFQRGAALAPAAIRAALGSPSSNAWTESLLDVEDVLDDIGDIECGSDPARARERIETHVRELARTREPVIALGGDHSITYPILRGMGARREVTVVQIDAHPDLYPEFEGDRYSHACPFARILEEGLIGHLVQVGVRAMSGPQRGTAEGHGVEQIDMRAWSRGVRPSIRGPVYLSVDVDAIDPAFAPGVSHPEPGGLSVRDVLDVIQAIDVPIVGADVVELNPANDPAGLTARVAAKIVKELAGRCVETSAVEGDQRAS